MRSLNHPKTRWLLPIFILVASMGYLIWTKDQAGQGSGAALEATKSIKDFVGSHYYELNMEGEVPMTSPCTLIDEAALVKFANYNCTESDDRILSEWSCAKPSTGESPTREYIEITAGEISLCQKKLEDFRDRFQ